ncbi:MAG: D-cysteine desulfhydrase family protein [Clostridia bacterium]|nr:D-cysteine desulfhydrase family protein [Clostridia bacterium]MDO5303375.1 D-cysteine desulfhydrase family protein [Clostridia bacterium]
MTLGREKINYLNTPTPLDRMNRLSDELGINLYLKRDDVTNFGTGGNKLRKLEYLVKDAMDQGATFLLTVGGAQTNHGRLTAAIAAKYGLKAAIVAVDPYPGEISANLLLDGIMGCDVYLVNAENHPGKTESEIMAEECARITLELEKRGEKVYYIPVGGSNELGTLGYYDCAVELSKQTEALGLKDVRVVTTVGSMGTYLGLVLGTVNENLPLHITGIAISPKEPSHKAAVKEYFDRTKKYFDLSFDLTEDDFDVVADYTYGAYNNPVKEVREALYYMGRMEGIILDPCYTGKTFTGLLDMVKKGIIKKGENVVMIHTGGIPGNYTKHHRLEMEKELAPYIHIV